jgi:hypothetical protein
VRTIGEQLFDLLMVGIAVGFVLGVAFVAVTGHPR